MALVILALFCSCIRPQELRRSDRAFRDSLGVNIHFLDPESSDLEGLSRAGFRWIRTDLLWQVTEAEQGKYDFTKYDRLMDSFRNAGIRAILILDYRNKLYDDNLSPHTDRGREAFASWAVAAVRHFRGRGIYWEIYNEPNNQFWKPKPNVDDYVALAVTVSKRLRVEFPGELIVGPAVAGIDFAFLQRCFQAGLLDYWDAVTVHPYRQEGPETAAIEIQQLRELIDRYKPKDRSIEIIAGEWGYSSVWRGKNDDIQAALAARELIFNHVLGIAITIWYDWRDDGDDPDEAEDHFGLTKSATGATELRAKPSFNAIATTAGMLGDLTFEKRIVVRSPEEYVLMFSNGNAITVVLWTTNENDRITFPVPNGSYRLVNYLGETTRELTVTASTISLDATSFPQYLTLSR